MNQNTDYTPVALYARVSSDRQDVDLSVAAQLRALRDYARKNGYLVAREFIDEAESGRIADRPEFRKMIDEASRTTAPFKEILVWKFSRFTRKREHAVAFKSMLVWGVDAKDGAPPVRVEDAFPAIVTKQEFRRITRSLHSKAPARVNPRRASSPYLLSGLVKCEKCGKALTAAEAKSGKYSYYVCHSLLKKGKGTCKTPRLNSKRFERLMIEQIRANILTENNIRDLVRLMDEEMDGVAAEQRERLENIEEEFIEVRRRLDRVWHVIENSDLDISDATSRIREHRERQEKLEIAAEEARALISERRAVLDNVDTIAAFAEDMSEFLMTSGITESRAFIKSFVKEIKVKPGKATVYYTIPISQSTQETELLLGGRSEEIRVGNEAEASSQLVWDVDGRLHPEEQPCAELWPSQQFLFPVDVFLQSLPQLQP